MFSKTTIVLSAAFVLGLGFSASAATKRHPVSHIHPTITNPNNGAWWPRMQQRLSTGSALQATRQLVTRCRDVFHAPTPVRRGRASFCSTVQGDGKRRAAKRLF